MKRELINSLEQAKAFLLEWKFKITKIKGGYCLAKGDFIQNLTDWGLIDYARYERDMIIKLEREGIDVGKILKEPG